MRARYPSDSYASEKARRMRRIENRACPELQQAYQDGQLSLRQYDLLSRRPATQQKHVIAAEKARISSAFLAAETINQLLDTGADRVRLSDVELAVRSAVSGIMSPDRSCTPRVHGFSY
jgi:hypothetical protein